MMFIIKCAFAYGSDMVQQEFCQDCRYKHDCREIYRRLGHATCPSILRKVIVAFLLPLVVFIVSLAIFDEFFAVAVRSILRSSQDGTGGNMQELQTAVSFFMALLITSVCVVFTRAINKRLGKDF